MPAFYSGLALGTLLGLLIAFAIVTRPRVVPRPFLIGRDALVPRSAGLPTAWRRRSR